jgi:signal transduction histidine kinase
LLLRVAAALDADTCAVLLLDPVTNELVAHAARGIEEEVDRGVRIPVGEGFAGRIAASKAPLVLDDVDHADVRNPLLREKGVKSMAGVPLLVHGDVIGVLHVGTLTPRTFTDDDLDLLQLAAERTALAIAHGRTHEDERRSADRLLKIQSVTDAALAHLNLSELLDELLVRVRDILEADTCAILLLDEQANELVARAARGIEEEVEQGVRIPVGKGFAGRVASTRRPIVLDDVDHADILNPILSEKGIKSMAGAPLLARERVLGVIHVGSLTPRLFTADDVELLERAAERAAMGLEKALLHEELIRLDHVRHAFVSIASHELRTPTAAVLGAALTLAHRDLPEDLEQELKEALAEQAQRLANLLEQLLDLSRLEAEALEIKPVPIRLRDRLEEIVAAAAATAPEAIEIQAPSDLVVDADPVALERVVSNLVVNALRYGDPPVVISAVHADRHLRLTVEDHGRGIPEDVRPRLFDQFTRGATSSGTQGSGLGLAIARSYAQAHGGDLLYDPTFASGARFHLVLPAQRVSTSARSKKPTTRRS